METLKITFSLPTLTDLMLYEHLFFEEDCRDAFAYFSNRTERSTEAVLTAIDNVLGQPDVLFKMQRVRPMHYAVLHRFNIITPVANNVAAAVLRDDDRAVAIKINTAKTLVTYSVGRGDLEQRERYRYNHPLHDEMWQPSIEHIIHYIEQGFKTAYINVSPMSGKTVQVLETLSDEGVTELMKLKESIAEVRAKLPSSDQIAAWPAYDHVVEIRTSAESLWRVYKALAAMLPEKEIPAFVSDAVHKQLKTAPAGKNHRLRVPDQQLLNIHTALQAMLPEREIAAFISEAARKRLSPLLAVKYTAEVMRATRPCAKAPQGFPMRPRA